MWTKGDGVKIKLILYTYKQVSNHGINHGLRFIMNLCPLTKKKNNLKHVYWSNIVKIGILNRCQFFLLHYNSNPRSYRQVSQITKQKQPIFDNVLHVFRRLVLRSNVSRFYLKYFFLLIYMHIFIKKIENKIFGSTCMIFRQCSWFKIIFLHWKCNLQINNFFSINFYRNES